MRTITEADLADLAAGAAILGTGGGGDPHIGMLLAQAAIRACGPVETVALADVPGDAFVISVAMMGAPTVMLEKLPAGTELQRAFSALERHLGRRATHVLPMEIGGINSQIPIMLAARHRLPLVDADLMGRAWPELQMCLPTLVGLPASPIALADEKGNVAILDTISNLWTERFARSITVDMGSWALIALYSMSGRDLGSASIDGSVSLIADLGRLTRETRAVHGDVIGAILERLRGIRLFSGRVVDVSRRTVRGFARAEVVVDGLGADLGSRLVLQTQNEHLLAARDGSVVATTPDLIIVVDTDSGKAVTTEMIRYGNRVTVIGAPGDPRWRTSAGLDIVGPRYFGYDVDYVPVELAAPASAGASMG